ncbi:MAG: hypothetical protein EU550_00400, partial [Promethearchaeota archaeon]
MRLLSKSSDNTHEITGFSKDKILELKEKIAKYKSGTIENTELQEILRLEFPQEILSYYSEYLKEIEPFLEGYIQKSSQLKDSESITNYLSLKNQIFQELERYGKNLLNFKLNCQ